MAFQPGQSGNPSGGRKEKLYRDALRKILCEPAKFELQEEPKTKLEAVVRAHVKNSIEGKQDAINALADRLDGKVPQAIVGDEDEAPISVALVELRAVYPKTEGEQ